MGIEYATPPLPDVLSAAAHTVVRLPSGVRRSARLPFWDITWSGAGAYAVGTAYASMTDSSAAILTAIATAASLGIPVVGKGRYRVDATITLAIDADFSGAEFVCNDGDFAPLVRVGTTSSGVQIDAIDVKLPKLTNAFKTGTGWTSNTSVGVEIANLMRSRITIPWVLGFETGVLATAYGSAGTSYNDIFVGLLYDNKIAMRLRPDDATAWVNENTWLGGSYTMSGAEGSEVAGVYGVLLGAPASGNGPNNNLWIRPAFEGDAPEFQIKCVGGKYNRWLNARFETVSVSPKVSWDQIDAGRISQYNQIDGGYNAQSIVPTVSANSKNNGVRTISKDILDGHASTGGVLMLRNTADDNRGISIFSLADDPATAAETAYQLRYSANLIQGKERGDTAPRWQTNHETGVVSWGPGNAAVDTNLYRNAVNVLKTDDKLIAALGIGVGNSAAATTPGTVVRRMEVFDASGASLGFVAIYDGIS